MIFCSGLSFLIQALQSTRHVCREEACSGIE